MGKLVGLVGSITNKIGNFVFSTWKGIQVAKAYQPNVSNPRSAGQTAQRTKFDYAGQYGIAMSRTAYLKKFWSLLNPVQRSEYNEMVSRNLLNASFEADNTLGTNKIIVSDNNGFVAQIDPFATAPTCALGDWAFAEIDCVGCGDIPDGILAVTVFNANLLADPNQSPFRDARICETVYDLATYGTVGVFPMVIASHQCNYADVFATCVAEADIGDPLDACLFLIPYYTDGSGVSPTSPADITKVGNAVLVYVPTA